MNGPGTLHVLRWPDGRYSVMRGIQTAPVVCVPRLELRPGLSLADLPLEPAVGADDLAGGTGVTIAALDIGKYSYVVHHRFKHVGSAYCQLADCPPVEVYEHAGVVPPEAECP